MRVLPSSVSKRKLSQTRWRACGSSPVVGSSRTTISGSFRQGPGDEQAPLHPPGELLDPGFGLLGELHEVEKLFGPPQHQLAWKIVVPAVDEQVLFHLELVVQVVLLGDDPDAAFDLPLVVEDVETGDGELSSRRYYGPVDHLHRRRLSSPVRAQKTETLSTKNLEVDTLDRLETRIGLLQIPRHQGRIPRQGSLGSLRLRVQPPASPFSSGNVHQSRPR